MTTIIVNFTDTPIHVVSPAFFQLLTHAKQDIKDVYFPVFSKNELKLQEGHQKTLDNGIEIRIGNWMPTVSLATLQLPPDVTGIIVSEKVAVALKDASSHINQIPDPGHLLNVYTLPLDANAYAFDSSTREFYAKYLDYVTNVWIKAAPSRQ